MELPYDDRSDPRVLVLGDLMTDVVTVLSGPVAPGSDTAAAISLLGGGSAANTAAWLAALDVPVAYVGRVGDDAFGRAAVEELRAAGVRCAVAVDPVEPTGTCVVLVGPDGERSMLPDTGANGRIDARDLPEAWFRPGRHLHVSGYALLNPGSRGAALAAVELARGVRMTVSVDPSSAAPLAALGAEAFLAWTGGCDLLLANADEARVLTGEDDPRAAVAALAEHYGEAVVTCGAAGALWHGGFRSGYLGASAGAEHIEVVDTTGAGDAFDAGFLAEWLLNPEPEGALSRGNRTAALAVARVGGRPATG